MKRLFVVSTLLIFSIILNLCVVVTANNDSSAISKIGLYDDGNVSDNNFYTRGQFAKFLSMLYNFQELASVDTKFSDVKADNKFSGYINYLSDNGIMNGISTEKFGVDDPISVNEMLKYVLDYAGYQEYCRYLGGFPLGYKSFAFQTGMLKGVTVNNLGYITNNDANKFIINILTAELPDISGVAKKESGYHEIIVEDSKISLLDLIDINVYTVDIVAVDVGDMSVDAKVIDSVYNCEEGSGRIGETLSFKVKEGIDINKFEHTLANVWLRDDVVLYMELDKDCEVYYDYIYAINDDIVEGNIYHKEYIKRITMYDGEEYEISNNWIMSSNDKVVTDKLDLIGRFAKIVVYKDEIIYLENWNFEKNKTGIVKEIDRMGNLTYSTNGASQQCIKGLLNYSDIITIIDGESTIATNLKSGTLFSYYIDEAEDKVVIVASEVRLVDKFASLSDEVLNIGNVPCKYERDNLFIAIDGVQYNAYSSNAVSELLGQKVIANVDAKGYVRYLAKADPIDSDKRFIAALIAYKQDAFGKEEIAIKKAGIENPAAIYSLSRKVKYVDTEKDIFIATASSYDVDSIYFFRTNSRGEIIEIEKLGAFGNLPTTAGSPQNFGESNIPLVNLHGKDIYFREEQTYILYKNDEGKIVFNIVPWEYLNANSNTDVVSNGSMANVYVRGDKVSIEPYVFIIGEPKHITIRWRGIITDKGLRYNSETGEVENIITVLKIEKNRAITETTVELNKTDYDSLSVGNLACFADSFVSGNIETFLYQKVKVVDLSKKFNEWTDIYDGTVKYTKVGVVKSITELCIIFEDGDTYFVDSSYGKPTIAINENARIAQNRFEQISYSDIKVGDKLAGFFIGDAICVLFVDGK